jgi:hypothetical protein
MLWHTESLYDGQMIVSQKAAKNVLGERSNYLGKTGEPWRARTADSVIQSQLCPPVSR